MKWAEVSISCDIEDKETVSNIFLSTGINGILEKRDINTGDILITGYIEADDDINSKIIELENHLNALSVFGIEIKSKNLNINYVEDDNWADAWKKYFKPFSIGRFVIKPTWEEYDAKGDELILELDPGMAFGTGQHPTTQLCMEALADYIKPEYTLIDAGCGSGILCIAASKMGFKKAYAFDIETNAISIANENFERLGIKEKINCYKDSSPINIPEKADLILANIIANVIKNMAEDLTSKLKDNGCLIASGIIENRYEEILHKLESCGLKLIEKRTKKEWVCLIMCKV